MFKPKTPELAPAGVAVAAPARWQDYVQLLKPRVMSLVVFTALTGLLAARAPVNPVLGFVAVLCIAIGAGASGALNMWLRRRHRRPHASHPKPAGAERPRPAVGCARAWA